VYHIGDHYVHEESRGVEDVSSMARAMYEEDHFERFSPTSLMQTLSSSARYLSYLLPFTNFYSLYETFTFFYQFITEIDHIPGISEIEIDHISGISEIEIDHIPGISEIEIDHISGISEIEIDRIYQK